METTRTLPEAWTIADITYRGKQIIRGSFRDSKGIRHTVYINSDHRDLVPVWTGDIDEAMDIPTVERASEYAATLRRHALP